MKCLNCQHDKVCKYKDTYTDYETQIKENMLCKEFKITISCNNFCGNIMFYENKPVSSSNSIIKQKLQQGHSIAMYGCNPKF